MDVLRHTIERAGHEVCHIAQQDDDLERLLEDTTDLVVAAGGDGTVVNAASLVAGRSVPLAILPLGTANNIARCLGIEGPIEKLIARWARAPRIPFDLGVVAGTHGQARFVEGVGAGLIPEGIAAVRAQPDAPERDSESRLIEAMKT